MMSAALKMERKYTVEEWLERDEGYRCEIIDGELYEKELPTRKHQEICGNIYLQIGNFLDDKPQEVYFAPTGVILNEGDETGLEPDLFVLCDLEKFADGRVCRGAPDMVVEVLSPSTSSKDKVLKLKKYMMAGVREYWIVDPSDNTVQVVLFEDGKTKDFRSYSEADTVPVHILEGCEIDLKEVFTED
jgi:Uma2 family endonuclease